MSSPRNGLGLSEAIQQNRERELRELIDSAIERARTDDAAWQHLRNLLVKWASTDEVMRRELAGQLVTLGKGRRGNAKTDAVDDGMLVGLVKVWSSAQGSKRMTVACALLRVADMFPGRYPRDFEALRKRYYKALKDPEACRIAGLE